MMAERRRSAPGIPAAWAVDPRATGETEQERLTRLREQVRRELVRAGKDSSPETITRVMESIAETGKLPDDVPDAPETGLAGDVADHFRALQEGMLGQLGDVAAAYGGDPTAVRAMAGETAARMTPEYQRQRAELEQAEGLDVLGQYASNLGMVSKGIMGSAPLLATALATRGIGPAVLPRAAGPVARQLAAGVTGEGAWAGQSAFGRMRDAGVDPVTAAAAAAGTAGATGIIGGAGALLTGRLGAIDPDVMRRAAGAAPRLFSIPAGAAVEGIEEVGQEVAQSGFEQAAGGDPFFEDAGTTAAHAFTLGAAMGGAVSTVGAATAPPRRPEPRPTPARKPRPAPEPVQPEPKREEPQPVVREEKQPVAREVGKPGEIDTAAWETASETETTAPTTEQIASAIESRRVPHEAAAADETLTESQRADAGHRATRGSVMLDVLREGGPELDRTLAAINRKRGASQRQKMLDSVQAIAREAVRRGAESDLLDVEGEVAADARYILDNMTDRNLQAVWRNADAQFGSPGEARLANPRYQEHALLRHAVERAASGLGQPVPQAVVDIIGDTPVRKRAPRFVRATPTAPAARTTGPATTFGPRVGGRGELQFYRVSRGGQNVGRVVGEDGQWVVRMPDRPAQAFDNVPDAKAYAAGPAPRTGQVTLETGGTAAATEARAGKDTGEWRARTVPKVAETEATEATSAYFPKSRQRLPARFVVVDASELVPSHDPVTYSRTDPARYPARMQARPYTSQDQAVVEEAVLDPDYSLLTRPQGENVAGGPPTILPGGAALTGTQRSMIIQRIYREGGEKAERLRAAVVEEAQKLGMSIPDDVRQPALARMVEPDAVAGLSVDDLRRLNKASDEPTQKAKSPLVDAAGRVEQLTDAEGNPGKTLTLISDTAGGQTLSEWSEQNAGKLTTAMLEDGLITDADRARILDDDGVLNADGRRLLGDILKVAAVGSADAAAAMSDSAAAKMANSWQSVIAANRTVPMTEMMGAWARLTGDAARGGLPPGEFARQGGLIETKQYSEGLREFAIWMDNTGVEQVRATLESIANENMEQPDMFTGELPTVPFMVDKYFGVRSAWTTRTAQPAAEQGHPVTQEQPAPQQAAAFRGQGNTALALVESVNNVFARIAQLPDFLRSVVTQGIQRGAIARRRGDIAVREGREPDRPGAELDITLSPVIQAEKYFGDLLKAVARAGMGPADWDGLVVNGQLSAEAPAEVRWALQKGVLASGNELVGSGLVAGDTDVTDYQGALDAVLSVARVTEQGLDAQGIVDAVADVAQRARTNRGRRRVRDWQRGEGNLGEEVQRESDSTIEVWENGERKFYESDPYIAAYTKTDGGTNSLVQSLATVGKLARAGQLTYNLAWQLINIPRDFHRSLVGDRNYHTGLGILYAINDLARSFPSAVEGRLDPLERARIVADPRTSEGRRARLEELAAMERIGWMPSESRADILSGRAGGEVVTGRGRVPDIRAMLGRDAQAGRNAWAQFFSLNPFSYMPGLLDALETRTRVAAWRAFERKHGRPPNERDVAAILAARENIGSPAYGPTYRGTVQGVSALFMYGQSIANGFIADHRALVNPTTRKGALAMLSATVIAPGIFQSAAREGLLGGEDDDGYWGDYVRGLQSLPTWRLGVGIHLPAWRRVNEDGEREFVMFTLPINPTFAPLGIALAGFGAQVGAGDTALRSAGSAVATYMDETLPTSAVGIELARDLVQFRGGFGENPYDEFRGRGVFTDKEWREFSWGEKNLKMLYHVGDKLGWGGTVGGILSFANKEELARARSRANKRGLKIEEAPGVGPLIRGARISLQGVAARFLSTRADYGRSESIRLEQEAEAARTRGERRAATVERAADVESFREANEFGPGLPRAIDRAARRYSRTLSGTTQQKAAKVRSFRRDAFLAYDEHEALRDALFARTAAEKDRAVELRSDSPTAADNIRGLIRSARTAKVIGPDVARRWLRIAGRARG